MIGSSRGQIAKEPEKIRHKAFVHNFESIAVNGAPFSISTM